MTTPYSTPIHKHTDPVGFWQQRGNNMSNDPLELIDNEEASMSSEHHTPGHPGDNEVLDRIRISIRSGIQTYASRHPDRSQSRHRQQDILNISMICDQANDASRLMEALEDYFSSDNYYTGPRDSSHLEQCIANALLEAEAVADGLNVFGYNQPAHPAMGTTPDGAEDSVTNVHYNLDDCIKYAIDNYLQQRCGRIKPYRQENIRAIHTLLQDDSDAADKMEAIRRYVRSSEFSHPVNSQLKQYLLKALDNAMQPPREVATRIWRPAEPVAPTKILLYLHGWHDSVNSGDRLAHEAVQRGFTVIACDHRGHGRDGERHAKHISTDLLRLDFRAFLQHVQTDYPDAEIALAGHSMGGAILTTESAFIRRQAAVKSVSLIAPAVMSGLGNLISPAKIFYRNMHQDVQRAQQASDRFGGNGPSLLGLLNLMRQAAQALSRLFAGNIREPGAAQWKVYAGKKDISVNYREFITSPSVEANTTFFARADHALQFGHHAGSINRNILRDIEQVILPGQNAPVPG